MPKAYQFFTAVGLQFCGKLVLNSALPEIWKGILCELQEMGYTVLLNRNQVFGVHTRIGLGFSLGDPRLSNVKHIFHQLIALHSLPFRSGEFFLDDACRIDDVTVQITEDFTRAVSEASIEHLRHGRPIHGVMGGVLVEVRPVPEGA